MYPNVIAVDAIHYRHLCVGLQIATGVFVAIQDPVFAAERLPFSEYPHLVNLTLAFVSKGIYKASCHYCETTFVYYFTIEGNLW
jgi:hypothetical protein